MSNVALERAYGEHRDSERRFYQALAETFPIGCQVSYLHGRHNRVAEVLDHSADRIKLIGNMGVTYWKYWDSSFERLSDEDSE